MRVYLFCALLFAGACYLLVKAGKTGKRALSVPAQVLLLLLCMALSSCVAYRHTPQSESFVGVGLDADEIRMASGAVIRHANTSTAMRAGAQTVRDLSRMQLNTLMGVSAIKAAGSVAKEVLP